MAHVQKSERASERASSYASHDNARRRGKCRLITLSAISRYKVDGRRALKPPLGPASTSCATIPHRFRRLSPGETLPDLPLAHEVAFAFAGVSPRRNCRTIESQRPRNTPFHRVPRLSTLLRFPKHSPSSAGLSLRPRRSITPQCRDTSFELILLRLVIEGDGGDGFPRSLH